MRIPQKPIPLNDLFQQVATKGEPERLAAALMHGHGPAPGGKYRHWDVIRYLDPPEGLTLEEWWLGIKFARQQIYRELPFTDKFGELLKYAPLDMLYHMLHQIDREASGAIGGQAPILDTDTRDFFYIKSLFEEAITSSQLEGAATTRRDAKQMLREGRKPRNRDEQMIYNNYQAMLLIRQMKQQPLNEQILLELHRILTMDTLDDPGGAGRYRKASENVKVYDDEGQLLHDPPPAQELNERMAALFEFANTREHEDLFIHPMVHAILLHFRLAYEHPFTDGNGRTARALFYWSMARQGYWLMEYISISSILRKAPAQYARSFLYTETDDNDLTYFILYQLRVILRAIKILHRDLQRKMAQIHETELLLRSNNLLLRSLNYRQLALLNHGVRHSNAIYTIESHRNSNNITYQTARTDLLKLAELGLLEQFKRGRAFYFRLPGDLLNRLETASPGGIR